MKRVTVFGANGRVGSLVVAKLLQNRLNVTAFVHSSSVLQAHKNLSIVRGDIHDARNVEEALVDSDAVISTLGSWATPKKDILQTGMAHIIPGMQSLGIKRIVSLTGSEARASGDALSSIHRLAHFAAKILAGKILQDGEAHIRMLEHSGLDWTVVRSPVMNTHGSEHYRLSLKRPLPIVSVHRHAVVSAIVAQLDDMSHNKSAPFISR